MLTSEQLEERKGSLGASDASTILGLNKYKTPIALWLEKTGQVEPEDISGKEAVHFGNVLEDIVAQEYARRNELTVRKHEQRIYSADWPFMSALLDRVIVEQDRPLEIKTTHELLGKDWGDIDTDEIPDHPLVQVQHQMIVMQTEQPGLNSAAVAVLIGGNKYRDYDIKFDIDLAQTIVTKEAEFWNCVENGIQPEITTVEDLATLYAYDNGKSILATDVQIANWQRITDLKANVKTLYEDIEALEFDFKKALGPNAELLIGNDGNPLITWKKAKDSTKFNAAKLEKDNPDLYRTYLMPTIGSRRFLVKKG